MKFHAILKRQGETWVVDTLDLSGRNVKQFQKQLLPILNHLDKNQPSVLRKKVSLLERIKSLENKDQVVDPNL